MSVRIKRVYEAPAADDGERILVDRISPRGISKEKADFEAWMKDVAPSTALRKSPLRSSAFQSTSRSVLDTTYFFFSPMIRAKGSIQSGRVPGGTGWRQPSSIIR